MTILGTIITDSVRLSIIFLLNSLIEMINYSRLINIGQLANYHHLDKFKVMKGLDLV